MAKDTKGHGSNKRIDRTSTTHYADNGQTVHRVHWGDGSTTEGGGGTHMDALFARARREGAAHSESGTAANAAAANSLGGGHPKSVPVDTHPAHEYNRELGERLRNTGRSGRLPPGRR